MIFFLILKRSKVFCANIKWRFVKQNNFRGKKFILDRNFAVVDTKYSYTFYNVYFYREFENGKGLNRTAVGL